jgi:hypothetical protein
MLWINLKCIYSSLATASPNSLSFVVRYNISQTLLNNGIIFAFIDHREEQFHVSLENITLHMPVCLVCKVGTTERKRKVPLQDAMQ